MQSPVKQVKNRFREAVATRKRADTASVNTKGKEVLGFLRKQAKADLEALEAVFISQNDIEAYIAKFEDVKSFGTAD